MKSLDLDLNNLGLSCGLGLTYDILDSSPNPNPKRGAIVRVPIELGLENYLNYLIGLGLIL